ncbi:NADP-dependent oxidoreductase domain-containing protein [Lipomyces doorenjongii]
MSHGKIIFGAFGFEKYSLETRHAILAVLEENNIREIDTALAANGAPARFTIDTKASGFHSGALSKSSVLTGAKKSLDSLGTQQVDAYFLPSPDPDTALEETLGAIQELLEGECLFGKSMIFMAAKVHVLPTVFRGNYNAVVHSYESELFPLLHKLGIKFYAYSPIAGGFLVKSSEALKTGIQGGRWDKDSPIGEMYLGLYSRPKLLAALDEAGVTKAALAYRWVVFSSALDPKYDDGVIIGATKVEQLQESLKALEGGPLPDSTSSPVDNYHG